MLLKEAWNEHVLLNRLKFIQSKDFQKTHHIFYRNCSGLYVRQPKTGLGDEYNSGVSKDNERFFITFGFSNKRSHVRE